MRRAGCIVLMAAGLALVGCGSNRSGRLLDMASAGRLGAIEQMIIEGADVKAIDFEGRNLLMRAAYNGHDPVVAYMLASGANPVNHQDNNGWTALMCAAAKGHKTVVRQLLEASADPNRATHKKNTALMWAAHGGYTEVADLLLDAGATRKQRNLLGWSASDIAAREGFETLAKTLAFSD